ncbi:hypothetical protein EHI8A_081560 [Entamoeba histolytica HM-1:IMSS-B]|uniref:Uncharacterized protein n=3 Tax=Entamoeba histolytica TaxID=5759 RepID=A0A175JWC2_ENTHI|nr:hypothetical protein EHI8A_081560 [Entamoeba histolytica HM-1:IMSS-B]ENY62439.1 hypothetical protein EHI7A_109880 [Entamoeba histolytica HM-1:IMSS-A]GAT97653.1 hypothetical protein CL6EHI_047780 [Entamoeba histolytica]
MSQKPPVRFTIGSRKMAITKKEPENTAIPIVETMLKHQMIANIKNRNNNENQSNEITDLMKAVDEMKKIDVRDTNRKIDMIENILLSIEKESLKNDVNLKSIKESVNHQHVVLEQFLV